MRRRSPRRSEINVPNQWECRPHPRPVFDYFNGVEGRETFHDKRAIVFAHRRWGKDSVALNLMAMSAMLWPGNYIYMFPLLGGAYGVMDELRPTPRRQCTGFGLSSGD